GLVQQLQQGGLGEQVGSWISTGQNLPVSPDQLKDALGSNVLGQLAGSMGLDAGQAAGPLAQLLPQVVDALTPHGQLPAAGAGADLGSLLPQVLGKLMTPSA
ncbi:MAG TPA: YidB family protein, partial [Burkholderiaceae bacterium]|nr:YidB family protein [Burkholderiaceae bacterium]